MLLSMQLFSAYQFKNYIPFIEELGKQGYDAVEGYPAVFEDRKAVRAALDKAGMTMPSVHMPLSFLERDFDNSISLAREFGVATFYVPGTEPDDKLVTVADWTAFAERLNAACNKVRDVGFNLGWHNHWHEFARLEDGRAIMEVILTAAPDIEWQADITWVNEGGEDPFEWTGRYANRVTSLHFKEIAAHKEGEGPLGHLLDWSAYFSPERSAKVKYLVVEHEAQPTMESLYAFSREISEKYKTINS